jgi:hypothetical protein
LDCSHETGLWRGTEPHGAISPIALIAIELLAAAQGLDFQTQTAAMAARICLAIAQLHPAKHRSAKLNCFDCQCVGISS